MRRALLAAMDAEWLVLMRSYQGFSAASTLDLENNDTYHETHLRNCLIILSIVNKFATKTIR